MQHNEVQSARAHKYICISTFPKEKKERNEQMSKLRRKTKKRKIKIDTLGQKKPY